ncbi:MAG: TolC family protein [Candidatus Eiseniibacteriota bacterium]
MAPGCARYAPREVLEAVPPGPAAVTPAPGTRGPGVHAGADTITVEEAVARVLAANPERYAAWERLRAADADRVQAGAWRNPEAELEAEGFGGDRDGFEQAELTVGLRLPLELFGTRGLRADVAEARAVAERARYQEVSRRLAARTWTAFHRALAARERVRIAAARVAVTRETAATLDSQVDAGKISPLAGLRAAVERETARAALESAGADLHTAREELMALWQESGADSLVLAGELRAGAFLPAAEQLAADVLTTHPALIAARWNAERERRAGRLASRERWPDVVPGGGVRWHRDTGEQNFVAGLGVEVPLFDRGGAARHAAARRAEAAGHDLIALEASLAAELHTLLEELEARERALSVYAGEIVPRAERALVLARAGYDSGKFGYLDLLDAQRTVIDVEDGRTQALIAYDRTLVRLESLLGRRMSALESTQEKPSP